MWNYKNIILHFKHLLKLLDRSEFHDCNYNLDVDINGTYELKLIITVIFMIWAQHKVLSQGNRCFALEFITVHLNI